MYKNYLNIKLIMYLIKNKFEISFRALLLTYFSNRPNNNGPMCPLKESFVTDPIKCNFE